MAQPTSEELDRALRDSEFKRDSGDPEGDYYRTSNGRVEKRYTDGDHSRDQDDPNYEKHRKGDQY